MPPNAVKFRVPPLCPFCDATGTIVPETTVKAGNVVLTWCCKSCSKDWPITVEEQIERRKGGPDRRRSTRVERRKTSGS